MVGGWTRVAIFLVLAALTFWAMSVDFERLVRARIEAEATPLGQLPLGCHGGFTSVELCCAFKDAEGNRFAFCSY